MTQDWKLTVTIKDYDSYNDEGLMNALEAKLSVKFASQFFWYNGERPMFNHDGKGVITSTVFDAKIQNDIPEWWEEGFFPKLREFEVVATEENGDDEICWIMKQGKCVSCIQNGEELLDESNEAEADAEDEDSGDLEVDVWGNFSVQFYARQGAAPDENGKYSDYIGVVDDDWLIEPDCGSTFMGVYASEDCQPSQIYKDRVLPYVENGKAIGINQIDFESGNYSTEDYPEENGPTLRELLSIYQMCMDDSEDEEDGICLYRLGMDDDEVPWYDEDEED